MRKSLSHGAIRRERQAPFVGEVRRSPRTYVVMLDTPCRCFVRHRLKGFSRPVTYAVMDDLLARTAQPSGWAVLSTGTFY
jgi:hypothetical protein